jgi:hypothetical protein
MREGAGLIFSTGTSTSEDNLLEGVRREVTTASSSWQQATILMTQVHTTTRCKVQNCAWCDLPGLMSDEDSESENEEEEVIPFVDTKCFRTLLEAQLLPRSPYL